MGNKRKIALVGAGMVGMSMVYMKSKTLLTNSKSTDFWISNYLFHITLI